MNQTAPSDLIEKLADVVREAYARGFKDGRESTTSLVFGALGVSASFAKMPETERQIEPIAPQSASPVISSNTTDPGTRAPRGSVEPRVLEALKDSVRGKKPAEIAAETGVPENSVRGTLNRLRKDNRVFKVGDVWRPAGPIRQPDGSTVEVTPDGHIVSVPAHLAGNNTPDANAPGVKKDWG